MPLATLSVSGDTVRPPHIPNIPTNTPLGPQTFISSQAPEYSGGISAMLVCYCVCIVLALSLGASYWYQNRARRDEREAALEAPDFLDITDKENKAFVYIS